MSKRVTAGEARQRLGMLLNDVRLTSAEYVIERTGTPAGVVIPIETYRRCQEHSEQAFNRIEAIRQRLADRGEAGEPQKAIDEAARQARHQPTGRPELATNVLISQVLLPREHTRPIQDAWRAQRFEILTRAELLVVASTALLRPKPKRYSDNRFAGSLASDLVMLTTREAIERTQLALEDEESADHVLLPQACDGRADALIAGDKVGLELGRFEQVGIASPTDFLAIPGAG